MNDSILTQLSDLAKAFNEIGLKPVICGGLGIYLRFMSRQADFELRATTDIDLMITSSQAMVESNRNAILNAIKDDLCYTVCEDAKYFQFEKSPDCKLDILVPPMNIGDVEIKDFRVKLVKSGLHGYLTKEACFIEEGLEDLELDDCVIQLTSIYNLLMLKLFAFDDRHKQNDTERAQAHAYDIFVIAELSNREDYLQAKDFFSSHKDSEIIQRSYDVTKESFGSPDSQGWEYVLKADSFYPNNNIDQKLQKHQHCSDRLLRWFEGL